MENNMYVAFKGTLSGLRQFKAIEIPLNFKMMKTAFYFT